MATGDDWRRLAGFVRGRRTDLGLTQEEVAAAGGPSTATQRLIEGARQPGYRPAILRALEHALQWERGSARAILDGGGPAPLPSADDLTVPGIAPADQMARIGAEAFAGEMFRSAAGIRREIDDARGHGVPEDRIFTDLHEQALWSGEAAVLTPEDQRVLAIAWLRSVRPHRPPVSNTSPPVELAG